MTAILGPDGKPAGQIEASEVEEMTPAAMADMMKIVEKYQPNASPGEKVRQARHMLDRHPLLDKAFRDGLRQGRDVRERVTRGLGLWWESLAVLTPRERGYVVDRVKDVVMPKVSA